MLTRMPTRELTSNALGETREFTIRATGKGFRILIDGLYSDKIEALIRETWSNAYDAHIAAGCPERPFECQLPSPLNPEFRLRDYGVSMTHEQVMGLYSTLFESTKDTSNEQVGTFGLGSKSPFAYTDAFTVTAYRDGWQRVYSVYLNTQSVPCISLMHEQLSDEETGLELSFPVRNDDCRAFVQRAEKLMRGFDVPPIIKTAMSFVPLAFDAPEIYGTEPATGIEWSLHSGFEGVLVQQGCVVYPLTAQFVKTSHSILFRAGLRFRVPIGTFGVTASREALEYDDVSNEKLAAVAEHIIATLNTHISTKVGEAVSLWDAAGVFQTIKTALRDKYNIRLNFDTGITYRGRAFDERFVFNVPPGIQIHAATSTGIRKTWTAKSALEVALPGQRFTWTYGNAQVYVVHNGFYTKDGKTRMRPGSRGAIQRVYSHHRSTKSSQNIIILVGDPDKSGLKRALVKMGRPTAVFGNDIPSIDEGRAPTMASRASVRELTHNGYYHDVVIGDTTEGFYVMSNRGDIIGEDEKRMSPEDFSGLVGFLRQAGVIDSAERVFIVPPSAKRVARYDGMSSFLEVVTSRMREHPSYPLIEERQALAAAFRTYGMSDESGYTEHRVRSIGDHMHVLFELKAPPYGDDCALLRDLYATYHKGRKAADELAGSKFQRAYRLYVKLVPALAQHAAVVNYRHLYTGLIAKYPLLSRLEGASVGEVIDLIRFYHQKKGNS